MTSVYPPLRKFVMPETIYGWGAAELAGDYAANFGAQRAMVVTDPGVAAVGWSGQVCDSLQAVGIETVVFDGVTPNPKDYEVMAGAEQYLAEECDVILAVGGGSPMDCAKGIGIVSTNQRDILTFEGVDKVEVPCPPLLCIPTTAGTSADVSQFAIIQDITRRVKIAIISKSVVPDLALIDPQVTCTMPPDLTAATGMDAFVHAVEAYVSVAGSPLTDLHALEAVRLISQSITGVVQNPDDIGLRDSMMQASLYAGLAFSNASLGLVHAMAHSLGGFLDLPHGECNTILLDHVINFNFNGSPKRYGDIAHAMGLETTGNSVCNELTRAIREMKESIGVTATLSDLGVASEDLAILAEHAMADPCLATNPVQPETEEIISIYESAF